MTISLPDLIKRTKKMHLLYVEDNEEARICTVEMFTRFFDDIEVAYDGLDGLEKFKKQSFDLVITDINMPLMNGLEMISEIRKFNKDINIMVLSAHNEANFYEQASALNVTSYLTKPLGVSHLVETLSLLLAEE